MDTCRKYMKIPVFTDVVPMKILHRWGPCHGIEDSLAGGNLDFALESSQRQWERMG